MTSIQVSTGHVEVRGVKNESFFPLWKMSQWSYLTVGTFQLAVQLNTFQSSSFENIQHFQRFLLQSVIDKSELSNRNFVTELIEALSNHDQKTASDFSFFFVPFFRKCNIEMSAGALWIAQQLHHIFCSSLPESLSRNNFHEQVRSLENKYSSWRPGNQTSVQSRPG